jgi:hypothetical protein
MEGLPSDIFDHDVKTFPVRDSETAKKLEAQMRKAEMQEEADKKRRGRPPGSTKAPKEEKRSAQPPPPVPQQKRAGTIAQKTQKVRLYFHYLSHKISFPEPKTYPTTDEGLDELLDKIECQLHGEGGIEKAGSLYVMGVGGVEKLMDYVNPLGWNLSGPSVSLSAAVAANEEKWKDLVKEFAIENAGWFMFGPTKRLIATTVQLILAVDSANKVGIYRSRSQAQQREAQPAPEDLQKEGEDL